MGSPSARRRTYGATETGAVGRVITSPAKMPVTTAASGGDAGRTGGRVLVVDDDQSIRRTLERLLTNLG